MKSLYFLPSERSPVNAVLINDFIKTLKKRAKNIAFFRPIVSSTAGERISDTTEIAGFSVEEVKAAIANEKLNELTQNLMARLATLKKQYDFVVCEGVAHSSFPLTLDFDVNLEIAKNFNAALVNLVDGNNRATSDIINEIKIEAAAIKKAGCAHFGTLVNIAEKGDAQKLQDDLAKLAPQCPPVFPSCLDSDDIEKRLDAAPTAATVTPLMFEQIIFERAKANKKRIVLPESTDDRILRAAEIIMKREVADIILLGNPAEISKKSEALGIDLSKAKVIDPNNSPLAEKYATDYYEMRKAKGATMELARDSMKGLSYFGTMMVYNGDADGMVSGAIHATNDTVRPALQIIKTQPGISTVSSVFFMCLDTKVLVYGDCAIIPNPNAEVMAQIAISAAETAKGFGIEPKIAMLSYSTGSSGEGADVDKVKEAVKIVKEARPDLMVEGPIQYDAAVEPSVAKSKLPQSKVAGQATLFVFPDLDAGNIAYKAVQRSANAIAVGPVLQGLKKPVNDLSRGCLVADIVNTVAITAIQAQQVEGK